MALPILAFAYRRGSSPCQVTPHLFVSQHSHAMLIPRVASIHISVAVPRFDLHRFPIANPCVASRFHAPAVPHHAIPFNSIPMHRPSTRRLSLAAPGHAIHCASASLYLTQLCLCVATRFSTNPLHSSAVGSYSPPCLCFAKCFHAMRRRCDSKQCRTIAFLGLPRLLGASPLLHVPKLILSEPLLRGSMPVHRASIHLNAIARRCFAALCVAIATLCGSLLFLC